MRQASHELWEAAFSEFCKRSFQTEPIPRNNSLRLHSLFAPLREIAFSRKGAKRKLKAQRTGSGFEH
jgi:hypothetical protein